jgi:hypothetical protein
MFLGKRDAVGIDNADVEPISVCAFGVGVIDANAEVGKFPFVLGDNFRVFAQIADEIELVHSSCWIELTQRRRFLPRCSRHRHRTNRHRTNSQFKYTKTNTFQTVYCFSFIFIHNYHP